MKILGDKSGYKRNPRGCRDGFQTFKRYGEKAGLKFEMGLPDIKRFDVIDKNGNDVGEVQDFLYYTNTDSVNHALIGRGWLSSLLGERQAIIPFDQMTVSRRTGRLNSTSAGTSSLISRSGKR